jgi:flagellar hook protein FlgE
MMQSLYAGVSGMLANQTEMDIIGNNIANANTTGFKEGTANFTESFLQVSRAATGNEPVGLETGLGTSVNSTETDFSQGVFQTTNVPTDLGINGNGFFTVQDINGANYVTRNGAFVEDSNGYLRTTDGNFLMGVMGAAVPTSPTTGYAPDKIQIPADTTSNSPVVGFTIDASGTITVTGQDGTTNVVGYVTVQNYNNPNGLTDVGNSLYTYDTAAGTNQYYQPGSSALVGTMQSGVLEASNVNLSTEFANMIVTQSGFSACARVITVSDSMLQTVTNLKQS